MSEREPYARLTLRIRAIKIDKHQPRTPYIQIRIGHRIFVSEKRSIDTPWDDSYEFELSLHEHLFYTIQGPTAKNPLWEGRSAIIQVVTIPSQALRVHLYAPLVANLRWYDLKDRHYCYANLQDLEVKEPYTEDAFFGGILLETSYRIPSAKSKSFDAKTSIESLQEPVRLRRSSSLPILLPSYIPRDDDEAGVHRLSQPPSPSKTSIDSSISGVAIADDLKEVQSELKASQEINSLLKRISSWVFTNEDYLIVQNILNGLAGFGQGIEVGRFSLTIAFLLLTRFYRQKPVPFTNNLTLTKDDLDIPRIIFRYAYAAHGWQALYFFGKRSGPLHDVMSSSGNYRAVIEYLHLDPQDLLVCDLDQTRVFRPNFFVAIDRRLSAVIISIRGTMSLKDTLTDLSFEYVSWNGGIAHSGMLMAARWFFENVGKQLVMFCEEYNLQQILLTGYSLGGSTAALLTIMLTEDLRNTNTWPRTDGKLINIHCYSFATPAALSAGLAEKYLDLIDSFIFGDDIVPRLSYGTVADLQTLMVYAAEIGRAADLLGTFEGTELEQKLEACRKVIQEGKKVVNPKLRIPGRVYHLQSINAPGNRTYTVVDTCGPDRFLEVILKKNMLYDHLPNRYEQAFEDAYVTHLLHGLEDSREVATGTPVSLQDRMQSVIDLINDAKSSDGLSSTSAATKSP